MFETLDELPASMKTSTFLIDDSLALTNHVQNLSVLPLLKLLHASKSNFRLPGVIVSSGNHIPCIYKILFPWL